MIVTHIIVHYTKVSFYFSFNFKPFYLAGNKNELTDRVFASIICLQNVISSNAGCFTRLQCKTIVKDDDNPVHVCSRRCCVFSDVLLCKLLLFVLSDRCLEALISHLASSLRKTASRPSLSDCSVLIYCIYLCT